MVEIDDRFANRLFGWVRMMSPDSVAASPRSSVEDMSSATELAGISAGGLARAQEAWATALELWQDDEDAFDFLTRKHAMLDDRRPIVVAIESGDGLRSVQSIIGRLRYGSAA